MITIKNYVVPEAIEEAYTYLMSNKSATLFGGGAFIRMGKKNISTAIDLSKCNLNYITELEDYIEIGAMCTFGDIERSSTLSKYFNNILSISLKEIVGIQLRNIVTVGGTVYSKYGFSDFITSLMVLDTSVKLYRRGIIPLEVFLTDNCKEKDILQSIIIKKDNKVASFKSMRNSRADYAILNLAVSKDDYYKIAVGARPGRAVLACKTMEYINKNKLTHQNISTALDILCDEITFGTNIRGSSNYRKKVCAVLGKRALMEVGCFEA